VFRCQFRPRQRLAQFGFEDLRQLVGVGGLPGLVEDSSDAAASLLLGLRCALLVGRLLRVRRAASPALGLGLEGIGVPRLHNLRIVRQQRRALFRRRPDGVFL
jgi:hypothetical protein